MNNLSQAMGQFSLPSHAHVASLTIAGMDASLVSLVLVGIAMNVMLWSSVKARMQTSRRDYSTSMRALPYFGLFMTLTLVMIVLSVLAR